jgi:hypothetical protein
MHLLTAKGRSSSPPHKLIRRIEIIGKKKVYQQNRLVVYDILRLHRIRAASLSDPDAIELGQH